MLRASRSAAAKRPVRPTVGPAASAGGAFKSAFSSPSDSTENLGPAGSKSPQSAKSKGMQVTPVSLAILVGGVLFGVYLFKPSSAKPIAAVDPFKPQIAIVFGYGENNGVFAKLAGTLPFAHINATTDLQKMDELVQAGQKKFLIDGFRNAEEMREIARSTVQPDLTLEFGTSTGGPRHVAVDANEEAVSSVLKEHNLV